MWIEAYVSVINMLFSGFCLYTFLYSLFMPWLNRQKFFTMQRWDRIACLVFSLVSLLVVTEDILLLELLYSDNPEDYEHYVFMQRYWGPYWFFYWGKSAYILLISQLFWIEKLRTSRAYRLLTAVLLVLPLEQLIVYYVSLHREYLPSSYSWQYLFPKVSEIAITLLSLLSCVTLIYFTPLFREKQLENEPQKIHQT